MDIQTFLQQLQDEMYDIGYDSDDIISTDQEKFAVWVGKTLFDLNPQEADNWILFADENKGAISGYFEADDNKVHIITSWYEVNELTEIDKKIECLTKLWTALKSAEDDSQLTDAGRNFLNDIQDKGVMDIEYYLVINVKLLQSIIEGLQVNSIRSFDLIKIRNTYQKLQHPLHVKEPENLTFTVTNNQAFGGPQLFDTSPKSEVVPTLICALPMKYIYEWVAEYRNGLFDANLRLRLIKGKGTNELRGEIEHTIKEVPERMFIQNNGVTITCQKIEQERNNGKIDNESKVTLNAPQIVNGCQTSWVIHDVFKELDDRNRDLPKGYILAKIIETQDQQMSQQITTSSNKQNSIEPRDRKADDPLQENIHRALARVTENLGIFWDYKRGSWETVKHKQQERIYKVKDSKAHRILGNQTGGQIMLALVGDIHDTKNRGGQIFNVDELYKVAFNYRLPPKERFEEAGVKSPFVNSGVNDALNTYINDLLFGYAIYQYAEAVFKQLYTAREKAIKERLGTEDSVTEKNKLQEAITKISAKEFGKFWLFDVVRLVHLIVEKWVSEENTPINESDQRKIIRQNLVGDLMQVDYLDPLFLAKKKRSELFNVETDPFKSNILHILTPSDTLPLLGQWFNSLERLGEKNIKNLQQNDPVSARTLLLSRAKSTHESLVKALDEELNSSSYPQLFPKA